MDKIKILFLAANPFDTTRLKLDEEIRLIATKIRSSDYRDSIELISAWAVRPDDLLQLLNEHKPHIVHFSGHGNTTGEITLLDNNGLAKPVTVLALTSLLETLKDNIRIVVLNACYSGLVAETITQTIDCVVGMNNPISDPAAIIFAASFYRAIGFGRSIQESYDQGKTALLLEGISEENVPNLFYKPNINPAQIFLIPSSVQKLDCSATNSRKNYHLQGVIQEKTDGFIGRKYVFKAIEEFIENQTRGYFIIEGDPGVGKSAILAEYIRRNKCLGHFNIRSQGIVYASQFVENICDQITDLYGLPKLSLPLKEQDYGKFLFDYLSEAVDSLNHKEKIIIAVDALDEVDLKNHPAGANVLYLPFFLPENVYFILSQRRQHLLPFFTSAPQKKFNLLDHQSETFQDIKVFIQDFIKRQQLSSQISVQGLTTYLFIDQLANKSDGNFMYLRYVLPQIKEGIYKNLNIESLPVGLEGYYKDHWQRMGMTADPLPLAKIKIIYILTEVTKPVSRTLISQFSSEKETIVQDVIDEWLQFLHQEFIDGKVYYSIYHASFRDFLHQREIVQATGVTIQKIHSLIAKDLWRSLQGNE